MSLTSKNPEERARAVCYLVRRLLAEASVSDTAAAAQLGRSRQRFEHQLTEGRLYLDDLLALEPLIPGLAAELLAPLGLRVIPDRAAGSVTDILAALGAVMQGAGATAATTAAALPDGIDGVEAQAIDKECRQIIAALGTLQASVAAAVVGAGRSRR